MIITMTLQEVMNTCLDWEKFCDMKGFEYYTVNEGGGDIEVDLTTSEERTEVMCILLQR